MMTETTLYDEHNLSGLGKEVVAEIEVEIEYECHRGYPPTYMEPGADDELEITGCWPASITIEEVDIPESKDSILFTRLINLFVDNHRTKTFKAEHLSPEKQELLQDFCNDSQSHEAVIEAANRDSEDKYYDYPDND